MSSVAATAQASLLARSLATIGRPALQAGRAIAGVLSLLRDASYGLPRLQLREALEHAFELGNRSLFFVVAIMAFTGALMVHQAASMAILVVGDLSVLGTAYIVLLVREFAPSIVALMISARYGAGVAARLGTMQITEQVDALRMTGAEPAVYLVLPRVVGGVIGMVPVVIVGGAVAWYAGAVAANLDFGVGWQTYYDLRLVRIGDVIICLAKATAFGVAVPLVSCYAGLRAQGGAPGVGRATTWAVVGSSTAVLLLDLILGAIGYLVF